MTKSTNKKIAIAFSFLLVVGLAVYLSEKAEHQVSNQTQDEFVVTKQEDVNVSSSTTTSSIASKYKSGTYNATGAYNSPAGSEKIQISVTLSDDIVTNATFSGEAINPTSKNKQAQFSANFKQKVVGKNIDEVQLSAVGGASLTTKAFMEALAKIELEAKA